MSLIVRLQSQLSCLLLCTPYLALSNVTVEISLTLQVKGLTPNIRILYLLF